MEYYKNCLACGKRFKKRYSTSVKVFLSERTKYCSKNCANTGKHNHKWVGDKITLLALHNWVSYHLGKPNKCEICGTTEIGKKYEWSNKFHTYKRNLKDWQRLCKKCHVKYDIKHNGYTIHEPNPYGGKRNW